MYEIEEHRVLYAVRSITSMFPDDVSIDSDRLVISMKTVHSAHSSHRIGATSTVVQAIFRLEMQHVPERSW